MAEPWIRVHADIAGKPIVFRASEQLGVSENEAIGLLVRFWGSMSRHGQNGHVDLLTDPQIESWAGWRGKRGRFAAFIRSAHTDESGRVNEWDDYAGKLEQRRSKERDRLRKKRTVVDQPAANSTQDVAQQPSNKSILLEPARAVRNDTIRDTTTTKATTPREPAAGDVDEPAFRLAPYIDAHHEHFPDSDPPAGRYGKAFKKLELKHGADETLRRWRICLVRKTTYATPEELSAHWSEYSDEPTDEPIVDEYGVLTVYGERMTRPANV